MKEKLSDRNKKKIRYRERNGTTRVGDFLRKVGGVAPEILDIAGKVSGIGGLEVLAEKIKGTSSLSEFQKEIALKELEHDMIEMQEITKKITVRQ